jgi:GLPGLI family protein
MKHIFYILLFILFYQNNIHSQKKYGKAYYSISVKPDNQKEKSEKKNQLVDDLMSSMEKNIKNIKVFLNFSSSKSIYYVETPLDKSPYEESIFKMLSSVLRTGNKYYVSYDDKTIILVKESLGEEFLITKKLIQPKEEGWLFVNERKEINGFLCYKATRDYEFIRKGIKTIRKQIVWYAPEIPFRYGPRDFIGFPGLVLKLADGKIIYTLRNVKLSKIPEKIVKPLKGKKVSEEEYEKIIKEASVYYKRN